MTFLKINLSKLLFEKLSYENNMLLQTPSFQISGEMLESLNVFMHAAISYVPLPGDLTVKVSSHGT